MTIDKNKYGLSLLRPRKEQKPITMNNGINVYPITIGEIEEVKETNYYRLLNLLTVNEKQVEMFLGDDNMKSLIKTPFDLLTMYYCTPQTKSMVVDALFLFIKDKITFVKNTNSFAIGDIGNINNLHNGNFSEFQEILRFQNCIHIDKEKVFNPKDSKAKEIKEKLEKANKKINKHKKNENNEPLTLEDLVSVISSSNNDNGINLFNVWDLNMYQFDNQFNRMKMLEDYDVNIRQVLAGVDPDKLDLKHWMSKIT